MLWNIIRSAAVRLRKNWWRFTKPSKIWTAWSCASRRMRQYISSTVPEQKQRKCWQSPTTAQPICLRHPWPASVPPSVRWACGIHRSFCPPSLPQPENGTSGGNPAAHPHFRLSFLLRNPSDRRIGFRGGMKKVDGKPVSAFVLYVNGKEGEPAQFGEQLGTILEEEIPAFMKALGEEVAASGKDFETWYAANPERLKESHSRIYNNEVNFLLTGNLRKKICRIFYRCGNPGQKMLHFFR